jgi:Tfp pilus assembly protein PilN
MIMERMRLDYQRRELPVPRAGLMVLALSLAAAIAVGGQYFSVSRKLADSEATADRLEDTAHRHGILVSRDAKADGELGKEVSYANEVLRQLTLPWDRLFETIEAAGDKNVALLSLAPDRQKHVVRIAIEAKDPAAGLDYLKGLEARDIFQTVRIKSHQIQLQDPERPIRFTLQATWKDAP